MKPVRLELVLPRCSPWSPGPMGLTCVGLRVQRGAVLALCPKCARALLEQERREVTAERRRSVRMPRFQPATVRPRRLA